MKKSKADSQRDELPVYQAIAEKIRNELVVWRHQGKLKLPELDDLCRCHNASQMTVKKALNILVEENLIERIQRKGTFIKVSGTLSETKDFIGIVFPDYSGWAGVFLGMEEIFRQNGYRVLKYIYQWDNIDEEILAVNACRRDCAGVVIYPNMLLNDYPLLTGLLAEQFPFVLFDSSYDNFDDRSVRIRHSEFTERTVREFCRNGIRNIALISSFAENVIIKRVDGFRRGLSDCPADTGRIICLGRGQEEWWKQEIRNFLKDGKKPLAAMVSGLDALHELYLALRETQLRTPEDFQFFSYDFIPMGDLLSPRLSYASYDQFAVGTTVAQKLLVQLNGNDSNRPPPWVDFQIVHLDSTQASQ